MGCGTAREDGGVAGCEWRQKGQVESSAALDLGLRGAAPPAGRQHPVGFVGGPTGGARQRRSTQRPVPFWRESLVSLIPRLKMHFHAAEWWGAGSGLGG